MYTYIYCSTVTYGIYVHYIQSIFSVLIVDVI